VQKREIIKIDDHGEKAFDSDVKIETIGLVIGDTGKLDHVVIDSLITKSIRSVKTNYIISKELPYWILYRDKKFDQTLKKMQMNVFTVFRDRQITKKLTKSSGKFRVIKSRNIGNNSLIKITGYDCFIDEISNLAVKKFLNANVVLAPNLTYYPRAMFLPKNSIVDGSAAILIPKLKINKRDLKFFSSNEFHDFYRIARNYGTRSLNIDSSSVYFFGKLKNNESK
jgi:DNA (cytosine-5)-methyltransferase 1